MELQQRFEWITIPALDFSLFTGEFKIIFKIARILLQGNERLRISDELKKLINTLGEEIITAAARHNQASRANRTPAIPNVRVRDDTNAENDDDGEENENEKKKKEELRSQRSALAVAAVVYDQVVSESDFTMVDNIELPLFTLLGKSLTRDLSSRVRELLAPVAGNMVAEIEDDHQQLLHSFNSGPSSLRCALALACVINDQLDYVEATLDSAEMMHVDDISCALMKLLGKRSVASKENDVDDHLRPATIPIKNAVVPEYRQLANFFASPQAQELLAEDPDLIEVVKLVLAALGPENSDIHGDALSPTVDVEPLFQRGKIYVRDDHVDYSILPPAITEQQRRAFRDELSHQLAGAENMKQEELQSALAQFFSSKAFREFNNPLTVKSTTHQFPMNDEFAQYDLFPDFTVFKADDPTPMGRIGIIQVRIDAKLDALDESKHVKQLFGYLSAKLLENSLCPEVYGILTNGTWAKMYRARFAAPGQSFKIGYEKLMSSGVPKKDKLTGRDEIEIMKCVQREELLDCFEWFCSRTPEQLGYVAPRTVDPRTGKDGTYTLGGRLGVGESCRVFACISADERRAGGRYNEEREWGTAHVAKLYVSNEHANREATIYQRIRAFNVPNTTRMVARDETQNIVFVQPLATQFCHVRETKTEKSNATAVASDPRIEASHVVQLVVALRGLHAAGIVHRDIQYQNLFCAKADTTQALVNDFGRARLREKMRFRTFRALMQNDFVGLARAMKDIRGGEEAWESVMSQVETVSVKRETRTRFYP